MSGLLGQQRQVFSGNYSCPDFSTSIEESLRKTVKCAVRKTSVKEGEIS